ncbi:MAG: glycosyltransferase [Planctomycetales bacterium]|nr:glycosyltransferase [Planctomycetales bacterium]
MNAHLSVIMIVRDAAATLDRCISSVREIAGQIVVIDTGSTDATMAIAKRVGCDLHEFAWCDSFAAARNESLRHAKGKWCLWIDADESISNSTAAEIKQLVAENDALAAYSMRQVSRTVNNDIVHDQLRLFTRSEHVKWTRRVHEELGPSLAASGYELRKTNLEILHDGYESESTVREKWQRNLKLLNLELNDSPRDPIALLHKAHICRKLERRDEIGSCLELAWANFPRDDERLVLLAMESVNWFQRCNDRNSAVAVCRETLEHYPSNAVIRIALADLIRNSALHESIDVLSTITRSDCDAWCMGANPDALWVQSRNNLAICLRMANRFNEAEKTWHETLSIQSNRESALQGLAELMIIQGQLDKAEVFTAQLVRETNNGSEARLLSARLALRHNSVDDASRILCTLSQTEVRPRLLRAELAIRMGNHARSREIFDSILVDDPGNREAASGLAWLNNQCASENGHNE